MLFFVFVKLIIQNMISILNSANKKKKILKKTSITIYNCGPTVYNHVHIGNVRPLITFDVLYRYLLKIKKKVLYVHNFTDIDDKIINQAIKEKTSEQKIAKKYITAYLKLFKILNIKKMITPKVSDHIKDLINYVNELIKKHAAYNVDGDVYFALKNQKKYGIVSNKNINELLNGVRKENKQNKKFPLDFALWKKTKLGLNWSNPFSQEKGRPGWHTECCVLINKFIGKQVTIHGGGVDLKFPHHENENIQNIAMFKKNIADIWMHVGHVNVNQQKMSKSLNNFILVKDIVNQKNANGLRWFFYKTKYENPINYSQNNFQEANQEISKITDSLIKIKTLLIANDEFKIINQKLNSKFCKMLDDDLNLPNAITIILDQIKNLNLLMKSKDFKKALIIYCQIINELDVLGISIESKHKKYLHLIHNWKQFLAKHNYLEADKIRKQLIKNNLL